MTFRRVDDLPEHMHRAARTARQTECGLTRREFLATATTYGISAAAAYGMLGLAAPSTAQANPQMGGTVRLQGVIRAMKDPVTFDFNTLANFARGWLEYLVQYNSDGTFSPFLLESWEVNDDASQYTLNIRPGVTWNNGAPFTAADVVFNITRFCDASIEGNSLAGRFSTLVDAETGAVREGAIEIVDDLTVRLNLSAPDIAIIANLADYPAAIVHPSHDPDQMIANPIGTGPYLPTSYEVGVKAVLERNEEHTWWNAGNGAWLERVELIDYGEDPASWVPAVEAEEIDHIYALEGDFVDVFRSFDGWEVSEVATSSTVVVRPNQVAMAGDMTPYADVRVRRALALAVDNAVVLELGTAGQGIPAENHHVAPSQPEYSPMDPPVRDTAAAMALLEEAGMTDFEHELTSLDAGFLRDTADAVAAQLRDAGIPVKRTIIPSSTFWNNWDKYAFSATIWNGRPLAVQLFALAYTSNGTWNETAVANPELDEIVARALTIADPDARREVFKRAQEIMQEEGITLQPYWRSLFNAYKSGLKGGPVHVAQVVDPRNLYWEA